MAAKILAMLFVLMATIAIASGQTDYCTICADHTMCKYKGDGTACGTKLAAGLDAASQAAVLDAHNTYRRKVARGQEAKQPAAANMQKMVWDSELATVAQRWADQCTFAHDSCRAVARFKVGQNIYMSSGSKVDNVQGWKNAVSAWYNEVTKFPSANINPFKMGSGTGHYTQVVWAESKALGCGFSSYKTTKLFVCNYGPAGNINGKIMYIAGTACSQCPTGTKCNADLCA